MLTSYNNRVLPPVVGDSQSFIFTWPITVVGYNQFCVKVSYNSSNPFLLLTFDHVENVPDDVRNLDDEAEGVDIGREGYEWIRKSRYGSMGIDVYIQGLHVGASTHMHATREDGGANGGGVVAVVVRVVMVFAWV